MLELETVLQRYLPQSDAPLDCTQHQTTHKKEEKRNFLDQEQIQTLLKELGLTQEELMMLLDLYLKKMKKVLPLLKKAIDAHDYKEIAKLAHNIKGSSGNFRFEDIQKRADEIESMAKLKKVEFDYDSLFNEIETRIKQIETTFLHTEL